MTIAPESSRPPIRWRPRRLDRNRRENGSRSRHPAAYRRFCAVRWLPGREHKAARSASPARQNKPPGRRDRSPRFDPDATRATARRLAVSSRKWQSTGRRAPAHSSPDTHRPVYWLRCAAPASDGTSCRKWWPSASRPGAEIGSDSRRETHPPWASSSAAAGWMARRLPRRRAPGADTCTGLPQWNARDRAILNAPAAER